MERKGQSYLLNGRNQNGYLNSKRTNSLYPTEKKPENPIIKSCKHQCETLEQTIEDTNRKLKDLTNELEAVKMSNKKLSNALNNKSKSRTPKPWSELSTQYQKEKRSSFQQMFLYPFHSCRMTTLNQCNVN